ncbi:MAG: hypothetical protein JWQ18_2250, partial [Conexibacter sp.]|nr:hypothetical protein [Conexibacter sp.]
MSRRLLAVLTAVCLAALGLSAVALAHGGSGGKVHRTAKQHATRNAGAGLLGATL